MVVYIVVIAVLVFLLVASFRALSGGAAATEDDYRSVLEVLTRLARARSEELASALAGSRPPSDTVDPAVEVATAARKQLAGYQQQLARFEGSADSLGSARVVLSAAIEDLGWACRMVEPGTYWENPGVREAVTSLRRHGSRCLDEVGALVNAPSISGP